jgi:NADP-dependent 3-hydroxy acid dehydrogenase YdfG
MLQSGQAAVVTGAGSGIGRAIAVAMARLGLRVVAVGRNATKLADAAADCDGRAEPVVADVASEIGRAAIAEAAPAPLRALIHAAGDWTRAPLHEMSAKDWRALDMVNVHGPILLTMACLEKLQTAGGDVVFVNSTAALSASAGVAAYAASKSALRTATDVLRQEIGSQGVRVMSIFAGRTDTPMQERVLAAEGRRAPPGTLMQPEDVAAMIFAALQLPPWAEVTDIIMRPARRM